MNMQATSRARAVAITTRPHLWPMALGLSLALGGALLCASAQADQAPATQPGQCENCGCDASPHADKKPQYDEHKRRLGSADKPEGDRRFEERQRRLGVEGPRGDGRPQQGRNTEGQRRRPGGPEGGADPGAPGQMRDRIQQALFRDIDLSPEQREQVDALMQDSREQMFAWIQGNRETLAAAREELQAARESGDPDRLDNARTQMWELMQDAPRPDRDELVQQLRDILTPDQQAQLEQNLEQVRQRMQQMQENGPPTRGARPRQDAGPQRRPAQPGNDDADGNMTPDDTQAPANATQPAETLDL